MAGWGSRVAGPEECPVWCGGAPTRPERCNARAHCRTPGSGVCLWKIWKNWGNNVYERKVNSFCICLFWWTSAWWYLFTVNGRNPPPKGSLKSCTDNQSQTTCSLMSPIPQARLLETARPWPLAVCYGDFHGIFTVMKSWDSCNMLIRRNPLVNWQSYGKYGHL